MIKMTSESDYRQDPERDMPGMLIEGASYVGRLDIPELSLQLPVIGKWSYANLDMAPCVYSGSAYKDDMVIAGHSYVSHFAYLDDLQEGDTLSFTDLGGNRFDYRVTGLELLPP